jgi:hypothetical protein
MVVECTQCGVTVDGLVVASYESYEEGTCTTGRYTLLKCPRCESPALMLQTDDFAPLGEDTPTRIYPEREITSLSIPVNIRHTFAEAQLCFRSKAYTAAAIMCRKTLEGLADEHKINSRNLADALIKMREQGIIENRLYEWAEALRISGNEAAHGVVTTVSAQDANDIIEFTNALLEYVFTFQDRFARWKFRREATKYPPAPILKPPDEAEVPF